MKKDGTASIILQFMRTVLLADLIVAALVGLICWLFDFHTSLAYGTFLVWAGMALVVFACLIAIGGFASRTEDATAFSLSGAGNMIENLQRITDARSSNLGCFLHTLFAAIGLIAIGYIVQIIPFLF
jgi:hypothetical protein